MKAQDALLFRPGFTLSLNKGPQSHNNMPDSSLNTAGVHVLRLDPSLYKLGDEEAAFFKQSTGIKDSEELKQHILQVQKEAYAVCAATGPRGVGLKLL